MPQTKRDAVFYPCTEQLRRPGQGILPMPTVRQAFPVSLPDTPRLRVQGMRKAQLQKPAMDQKQAYPPNLTHAGETVLPWTAVKV